MATTDTTEAPGAVGSPRLGGLRRPRGEPRRYDFRHPSTLAREHVRTLQIVQETMASGFTTILSSSLRAVTHVAIRGIEQLPYEEYVRELPNPTLLTELKLAPLNGEALLQVPLPVAFAATELLLGGRGGPDQPDRAMTELERGLMHNIVELTLPAIRAGFEPVVELRPAVQGQEANPHFAQLAAPTDMVIVVTFDLKIEEVSGEINLCVPFTSLQPHLDALSASARLGALSADKLAEERARLHAHLSAAPVRPSARFRPLVATSEQIVGLTIGDVVMLNHPVEMPLTLEVDGTPVHDVRIGRVNRHYAVRVDDSIDPGRHRRPSRLQIDRSPAVAPGPA